MSSKVSPGLDVQDGLFTHVSGTSAGMAGAAGRWADISLSLSLSTWTHYLSSLQHEELEQLDFLPGT